MSKSSNTDLWENFKKGDKEAFQLIYQTYAPELLSYGKRLTTDISLLEDSIQDLFIELWKSGEKLSSTTSIKFYLFKALRYKVVRNHGIVNRLGTVSLDGFMTILKTPSHEEYTVLDEVDTHNLQSLKEALLRLPERQREAINLRYYHNFSNEEVASIQGITYNSVCKSISAALRSLKSHLKVAVAILVIILSCPKTLEIVF